MARTKKTTQTKRRRRPTLKKVLSSMIQASPFQQVFILFTILYVGTMLTVQYNRSYMSEHKFWINEINVKEKKLATKVETGLYINNFPQFSFYKNSFTMDALVWFKFHTGTESLDTIENFSFKNGEIIKKSDPIVQLIGNQVVISFQVVIKLITELNYKYFPVSDHKMNIIIQNKNISPDELYFVSSANNLELSENIMTGNWVPTKLNVDTGFIQSKYKKTQEYIEASFPCTVFSIDFKNENIRNFIILYLPLLLLFFLVFSSLLVKIDSIVIRFPVVAGVVPILALHSLVIESMSPIGSNLTKIDETYLTLIFLSMIILIFQGYLGLTLRDIRYEPIEIQTAKKQIMKKTNDFIIFTVLSLLILSITYSTFY